MRDYKHIFGPVPSRRLGRSLGIDLTPRNTCSFDCVFCQLGHTIHKTLRRKEYVPTRQVVSEFQQWLTERVSADYITLSGSGEPTLHSRFGEVIEELKGRAETPVALLTNGSVFGDSDVVRAAGQADLIKASLSAWNQESFEAINRPHPDVVFTDVAMGLRRLREEFEGELWIEVFIVPGLNSELDQVKRIAELTNGIRPDRVQLNTAVRPPAEEFVRAARIDELASLAMVFEPPAGIIADYSGPASRGDGITAQTIRRILERRPCTLEQMTAVSGVHRVEISKLLGRFLNQGEIRTTRRRNEIYFEASSARQR